MEQLQKKLDDLAAQKFIKQAIMAVQNGDGSFCWSGAAGQTRQNDVQINGETPFFIASIDKLYNAAIVLMLGEQGKLNLDDPISVHLPALLTRGLHLLNGADHTHKLTIRHLLSHTSGLEDYPQNGQSLIEQVLSQGDRALTFAEIIEVVRGLKPFSKTHTNIHIGNLLFCSCFAEVCLH